VVVAAAAAAGPDPGGLGTRPAATARWCCCPLPMGCELSPSRSRGEINNRGETDRGRRREEGGEFSEGQEASSCSPSLPIQAEPSQSSAATATLGRSGSAPAASLLARPAADARGSSFQVSARIPALDFYDPGFFLGDFCCAVEFSAWNRGFGGGDRREPAPAAKIRPRKERT